MEPKSLLPCSSMSIIMQQMNPVHALILYLFNVHFNNIRHIDLDLQSDVFSSLIKTLYAHLVCLMRATSPPIPNYFIGLPS
jgi:hypothetical protein